MCGELTEGWALRLARHRNVSVREQLAFSTPWLSALAQLSREPAHQVRAALAGSLFLLPQVRRALDVDPDEDVRGIAAATRESTAGGITPDPLWLTEEDLMAEALRQRTFGDAAAAHAAAADEHDRTTDAVRQRIMSGQESLPWPPQQDPDIDVPALQDVTIRPNAGSRPAWLAKADDVTELTASVLAGLGGLLEDHHELGEDLVIIASVPSSLTAQKGTAARIGDNDSVVPWGAAGEDVHHAQAVPEGVPTERGRGGSRS